MQFSTRKPENEIITFLAKNPYITIEELYQGITQSGNLTISMPQLYNILRKLRSMYIILKKGPQILLNQSWIQKLHDFIDIVDETHTPKKIEDIQLYSGENKVFYAGSLQELDHLWADSVSSLCRLGLHTNTYQYDSHNYYIFVDPQQENGVQNSFVEEPYTNYVLTGNNTFLDQYGLHFLDKKKYKAAFTNDSPFSKNGYYLTIIGDYLVEYFFPDAIFNYIHNIYLSTHSSAELDLDLLTSILYIKTKCRLTVRHNAKDAEKYSNIIKSYFDK